MLGQAFVDQVSENVGRPVSTSLLSSASSSSSGLGGAGPQNAPQTLEQLKSIKFQAEGLGFKEKAFVTEKASDTVNVFKITEITEDSVTVVEQTNGEDGTNTKTIAIGDFITMWKIIKGKVTALITGWGPDQCTPMQSKSFLVECAKGALALAIQQEWSQHSSHLSALKVLENPNNVYVTQGFKANTLTLVAASQRVETKKPSSGIHFKVCNVDIGKESNPLFLLSHFVPPIGKNGERNKAPWVVPFWAVSSSEKQSDANMALKYVKHVVHDTVAVMVPTLVNTKPLQAGEVLTWYSKVIEEPSQKKMKV